MKLTLIPLLGYFLMATGVALPQQAPPASRAMGVVEAIDASSGQITLHTDAGPVLKVVPDGAARFVKIPPGETSLSKAAPIQASEIATGDRILARGQLSGDKSSLAATLIVVMTKDDLAKKQQAEKADWQKRGVGGLVKAVDAAAGQVTITTRSAEGAKALIIDAGPKTVVRRYAPDSVKFADAKPGTLADIQPGDQVKALGEKNADGTHYTAEALVSGTFRNIAATVISIDAAGGTLKVTDLATKKPLTVRTTADSTLRKLPEMVAKMIAMRASAGGGGGAARPTGAAGSATASASAPGAGQGQRTGRGDTQQMLERLPAMKIEDLKPGDAVIISSTQGTDPNQVSAITLIAGVEPILSVAPAGTQRAAMLGTWNLDMNVGGAE